MNKPNKNLTSFTDHLNQQYGERESVERENFEESFEAFKLGVMLQEMRKEKMAQQLKSNDFLKELRFEPLTKSNWNRF